MLKQSTAKVSPRSRPLSPLTKLTLARHAGLLQSAWSVPRRRCQDYQACIVSLGTGTPLASISSLTSFPPLPFSRKATLKAHPDKEGGSEEKMAQLNEAYEVLSNPGACLLPNPPPRRAMLTPSPPSLPIPQSCENVSITARTLMIRRRRIRVTRSSRVVAILLVEDILSSNSSSSREGTRSSGGVRGCHELGVDRYPVVVGGELEKSCYIRYWTLTPSFQWPIGCSLL